MAVSKVILNGNTLMDVTQKTVTSASMLNGVTALKNDGTDIVGSYVAPTFATQSKTVSPSTSQQTVSPDSGYDGLSSVTVNAMPSGSATTPATTITANPTISVNASGLITASVSGSKSVTPSVSAGYVSSGTAGTVTVSGSNTQQLTAQAAQTITPTTTDQTIASGKYLTGVQTIKGDANLLPENIKKDVVIFGITGTYEGDVPSGYTVTVSLTNPINSSEFENWVISQSPTVLTDWTQIGTITSATGNSTVTVTEQYLKVATTATASSSSNFPTITGGILRGDYGEYPVEYFFEVTGDGTIIIDGVNYDD